MNILRQLRNVRRAENRALVRELRERQEQVAALYSAGNEKVDFTFDAFDLWGKLDLPAEIKAVLNSLVPEDQRSRWSGESLFLDNWSRGVLSLNEPQAQELAKLIAVWNTDSGYRIGFGPADGTEHVISVSTGGRHTADAWQL